MGDRKRMGQFLRQLRFFSYSYNFERDHAMKNLRLLVGGLLVLAGVSLTAFNATRDYLTPWVTLAIAALGVFLFLTADDAVIQNRDIQSESLPPVYLDQARTTGIYAGFSIDDDGYYLYSRSVNQLLMEEPVYTTLMPKPFAPDERLRRLAPYVMATTPTPQGKRLFNRDLRLASDLIEPVFSTGSKVVLQPTDYVAGVCTNEQTLRVLKRRSTGETLLNGLDLILEDRVVRSLAGSRCANLIGINSLVVLADGHYLVRQQTKPYASNLGELIPFVSASLSMDDYVASLTLQQMVSKAISSRLCEETGYGRPDMVRTAVIGYTRLLTRGGKPEFLAITFVDDRLEGFLSEEAVLRHGIRMPYPVQFSDLRNLSVLQAQVEEFNARHAAELSVQMRANAQALLLVAKNPRVRGLLGKSLGIS